MDIFSRFVCRPENQEMISPELIGSLGIACDSIYAAADNICAIAEAASLARKQDFILLPFCHTTEAKALGADIRPADDTAGPRAGRYTLDDLSMLPSVNIADNPDAARLIDACTALKNKGWRVVYQLSGPISILSCMMPLSVFFKCCRKDPGAVAACLSSLQKMLLDFADVLCGAGAEYISYSDPAGSPAILGPKYTAMLTEQFTFPFLTQLAEICKGRSSLLICPLTASSLSFGEHITCVPPKAGTLSVRCVKRGGLSELKNFKLGKR